MFQTLHCVCRIAEVLVSLQQVGNVKYIKWKMEFHCQTDLLVGLQENASKMEEELKEWNEKVKKARNKFYELNYYTTRQLLVLRSELGKLKTPAPSAYHQAQVMGLLQSISCEITTTCLEEAVKAKMKETSYSETPQDISEGVPTDIVSDYPTSITHNQPSATELLMNSSEDAFSYVDEECEPSEEENAERTFSVDDLNEKQRANYKNLTEKYKYTEEFALKAIEGCPSGEWAELLNWVLEHEAELDNMMQSQINEESIEEKSEGEEEDYFSDVNDSTTESEIPKNEEVRKSSKLGMFLCI